MGVGAVAPAVAEASAEGVALGDAGGAPVETAQALRNNSADPMAMIDFVPINGHSRPMRQV